MKKLQFKSLLALLLMLAMTGALFCPAALAETVLGGSAGETGKYFVKTLVRYNDYTVSLTETVGAVPPGLEFSDGDALVAFGTPTAPGSYMCTLHFTMVGRDPATPSKEGSFDFSMTVTGEAAPAATPTPVATPAPTPTPAAVKLPVIYKSPTDETVDVGKQAEFVARFDNAIWARWHFLSPDGQTDYIYNEIPKGTFPGLVIMNGDNSHLILKKIPYELNGWRVYCLYTNNDGSTPTEMATITVNPPPATPTPAPTPTPTPTPSPTPTSTPTPAPSEAPAVTAGPTPAVSEAPSDMVPGSGEGIGAVMPTVAVETPQVQAAQSKGVNKLALIAGAAVLLLGGGAGVWFFLGRPPEEPPMRGKHSKR